MHHRVETSAAGSIANVIVTAGFALFRATMRHPSSYSSSSLHLRSIGALSLILQKHPIHSALSLIVVMVALAGLYLLLGAEFVAAVQIIVYGGAIMVLFVS